MRNLSILVAISLMIGAANHCQAQDIVTVHANVGEMLTQLEIEDLIFNPFDPEWVPDTGDAPILFLTHCGGAGRADRMVPPAGTGGGGNPLAAYIPIQVYSFIGHTTWYEELTPTFDFELGLAALEAAEKGVEEILQMQNLEFIEGSIKPTRWLGPFEAFSLNSEIESSAVAIIGDFTYDKPSNVRN